MKLKYFKLFEWIFYVFYLGKGFVLSLFWHPNILGGGGGAWNVMALLVPDMRVFIKWYLIKLFQVARIMNAVFHDVVIHLSVPAPIYFTMVLLNESCIDELIMLLEENLNKACIRILIDMSDQICRLSVVFWLVLESSPDYSIHSISVATENQSALSLR